MPRKRINYSDTDFYVYALLDPRKPGNFVYSVESENVEFAFEPFYIGKGLGDRMLHHEKLARRNPEPAPHDPKGNKIRSLHRQGMSPVVEKVFLDLTEGVAFARETDLIRVIGRLADGGPLANFTLGGEGHSGHTASQETRNKQRSAHAARTPEQKADEQRRRLAAVDLYAVAKAANETKASHSAEKRAAIQAQRRATIASLGEDAKRTRAEKASAAMIERNRINPPTPVKCPHCGKTGSPRGVKKHHFDRCKLKPVAA